MTKTHKRQPFFVLPLLTSFPHMSHIQNLIPITFSSITSKFF